MTVFLMNMINLVFANGGLSAIAGSRAVTAAARHHHVPVVVCCGVFKFSPVVPFNTSQYTVHGAPDAILPFEEGK
jgi:translation initiation factor eIF-2B subunit beta